MMKLVDLKEQIDIGAIETKLEQLAVACYSIHPDGTVDVTGHVVIPNEYTAIPVKFGNVTGNFWGDSTRITSLVGAPSFVGGYFDVSRSPITSLVGSPTYVYGYFDCQNTPITSLEGISPHIGGKCYLSDTPNLRAILPILKVKGIEHIVHEAGGILMRHYKKDGTGDIIALQDDLIEAGFGHIARMKP